MADNMAGPRSGAVERPASTGASLEFARLASRTIMTAERMAPLILPLAIVVAAFLALSWFGFFRMVPDAVRIGVGVGFAIAAILSVWPLRRLAAPRAVDVDHRLERDNALTHRPITTQDETLARDDDPFAQALWKAHQQRIADGIGPIDPARARTPLPRQDPWALRALVPLVLVTAFAYSLAPAGGSLTDVARSHGHVPAVPARVDAWLTPPGYTGIAPIFLTSEFNADTARFSVPVGSEITVRIAGGDGTESVSFPDPDTMIAVQGDPAAPARAFVAEVDVAGRLEIMGDDGPVGAWSIDVVADEAPRIAFSAETPFERAANGTMTLRYTATDDYRVASAQGLIALADPDVEGARPLYDPPELPLALPRRNAQDGAAQTMRDLTEHPWAGAEVKLTLEAEDDLGQTGRSATRTLVLPGRPFANPLARALIEQRRILALDATQAAAIADLLDVLMLYPEETIDNAAHFLGLSTARTRLVDARNDDQLRDVVDYLWEVARQIEDGGLTDAERRLRQAQQALREALERGASEEEIAELVDELRQAMQEFMREFAERALSDPNMAQQMPQTEGQELDMQTLDEMLQQLEDMAQSGAREQAMDMLSQLENMMNNLQMGQGQQQQGQGEGQAQQQMNELGEILREQQQLMDETFRQNRQGQQGQPGEQGQQGSKVNRARTGSKVRTGSSPADRAGKAVWRAWRPGNRRCRTGWAGSWRACAAWASTLAKALAMPASRWAMPVRHLARGRAIRRWPIRAMRWMRCGVVRIR